MPVEVVAGVMADIPVTMVGGLSEDMPRLAMLGADTLVSVLAILREPRADTRVMQGAHITGIEAVTGEAVIGIRPTEIRWAITAWAMAIHPTGLAITVTATVGTMVRTTDTTLTATDTGRR